MFNTQVRINTHFYPLSPPFRGRHLTGESLFVCLFIYLGSYSFQKPVVMYMLKLSKTIRARFLVGRRTVSGQCVSVWTAQVNDDGGILTRVKPLFSFVSLCRPALWWWCRAHQLGPLKYYVAASHSCGKSFTFPVIWALALNFTRVCVSFQLVLQTLFCHGRLSRFSSVVESFFVSSSRVSILGRVYAV